MRTIHVGIIGCGAFGNFHLSNLLQMEGVEITALATGNEEKLQTTGRRVPGARLYHTHTELFENENDLDAVVVSITPDRHGDLEVMAARRGVAIYIEKPVTICLEEALRAEQEIRQAGIVCSVGYHGRYSPNFIQVKEILQGKDPGIVLGKWIYNVPDLPWWRTRARSGGQLVEQATHLFDLFRDLFGEAESVYTVGRRHVVPDLGGDVEDCSSTIITFKNGMSTTILAGCYLNVSQAAGDIGFDIYLQDRKIEYGFFTGMRTVCQQGENWIPLDGKDHFRALETFIKAVRSRDQSEIRSDYSDAVKTLRLTLAANRSMELGRPVRMDERW